MPESKVKNVIVSFFVKNLSFRLDLPATLPHTASISLRIKLRPDKPV